jgi:hypothetical protein
MPQNRVRVSQAAAWDRALVLRCLPQLGSHAETRRRGGAKGWGRVPQLPKMFWGNEGVLECSGLTELWMGRERVDGKIQSGVKPPQSKKEGSGISREGAKGFGWEILQNLPFFLFFAPLRLRVRPFSPSALQWLVGWADGGHHPASASNLLILCPSTGCHKKLG